LTAAARPKRAAATRLHPRRKARMPRAMTIQRKSSMLARWMRKMSGKVKKRSQGKRLGGGIAAEEEEGCGERLAMVVMRRRG
jgi:hypothetical protein